MKDTLIKYAVQYPLGAFQIYNSVRNLIPINKIQQIIAFSWKEEGLKRIIIDSPRGFS